MQVLVKYIQEFDNRVQDAEIGVAIVDVLRECIDLSYRPRKPISVLCPFKLRVSLSSFLSMWCDGN